MHGDICILSDEESFARMLYLELTERAHRVLLCPSPDALPPADLYLVDADRYPDCHPRGRTLRYGRSIENGPDSLHRPFPLADLHALTVQESPRRGLRLLPAESAVLLDGLHIRLTRLEYALLARLSSAEGKPVSREVLLTEVFGGEGDGGVLNVYIHYLRKKLERGGRRLLFALRGQGYMLREEEGQL